MKMCGFKLAVAVTIGVVLSSMFGWAQDSLNLSTLGVYNIGQEAGRLPTVSDTLRPLPKINLFRMERIEVFPDPASEWLMISMHNVCSDRISISMYNLGATGNPLITDQFDYTDETAARRTLSLATLKPGAYILTVRTDIAVYKRIVRVVR